MHAWRDPLRGVMGMDLKDDSLVVIPARTKKHGADYIRQIDGVRWTVSDCVKCLGRLVTSTGEDTSERHALVNAWTRLFWRNSKRLCNRLAPVRSRMKFWKQLVWGVGEQIWNSWRPPATDSCALLLVPKSRQKIRQTRLTCAGTTKSAQRRRLLILTFEDVFASDCAVGWSIYIATRLNLPSTSCIAKAQTGFDSYGQI